MSWYLVRPTLMPVPALSKLEHALFVMDIDKIFFCLSGWPLKQIIQLGFINRNLYYLSKTYRNEAWRVSNPLDIFFADSKDFRRILGECEAVVCGQQVLAFFDRLHLPNHPLVIAVRFSGLLAMGRHIQQAGFCFCPDHNDHSLFDIAAFMVSSQLNGGLPAHRNLSHSGLVIRYFCFEKYLPGHEAPLKAQIHLIRVDPVRFITSFQSSKPPICLLFR